MKVPIDEVKVDLPCHCGTVTQKSVGWIRNHSHETFTCSCGRSLRLDGSDVRRKIAEAERNHSKAGRG